MNSQDKLWAALTEAEPSELAQCGRDTSAGGLAIEYCLQPHVWAEFLTWFHEVCPDVPDSRARRILEQASSNLGDIADAVKVVLRSLS